MCEKLLGTHLISDQYCDSKFYNIKIAECQKMLYAMQGIGSHNGPIPCVTMSKLYLNYVMG